MVAEPKKAWAVRMVWSFSPLNILVREPCVPQPGVSRHGSSSALFY